MSEDSKIHQEEENKEVSSSQPTSTHQTNGDAHPLKVKDTTPLPETNVKPSTTHFKLCSFIGDDCKMKINNWIRMYESYAKRCDWQPDEMKWNLPSYLEEQAFDFYVEYVLSKDLDWEASKQSILKRFDQYETESFMEFLSCKWSPQMDLKEYFKKTRALGIESGLSDEEILQGLTRGVPAHLRTELSLATSLQQWVAIASCLEDRLKGSYYNKHQSWKGGRRNNSGGRGGNRPGNRPKSNHQQNHLQNESHVTAMNGNEHHNDA